MHKDYIMKQVQLDKSKCERTNPVVGIISWFWQQMHKVYFMKQVQLHKSKCQRTTQIVGTIAFGNNDICKVCIMKQVQLKTDVECICWHACNLVEISVRTSFNLTTIIK